MNWKLTLEVAGILAIVLSLVFVGLEQRQSNKLAVRDGRLLIMDELSEITKLKIENPALADVLVKLASPEAGLTPAEYEVAEGWSLLWMNYWTRLDIGRDSGFLPDAVFQGYLDAISIVIGPYPGLVPILREDLISLEGPGYTDLYERIRGELDKVN